MIKLALIGKNITHSKSAQMYEKIYNTSIDYSLLDYEEESFIPSAISLFHEFQGISITAPYKEHFIKEVRVDERFKSLNAINCLYLKDNIVCATNTDYLAIEELIIKSNYLNKEIIVLGNGAMFRVLDLILKGNNKKYTHLFRQRDGELSDLDFSKQDNLLIINACSRTFNYTGNVVSNTIFWDLNYSHEFHNKFLSKKLKYVDGINLLFLQAKYATKYWKINPL